MRAVIKTHRNMLDSYEAFIKSDGVDDETDTHALDINSVTAAVNKALGKKRTRPVPSPVVLIPKPTRPNLTFIPLK